VSSSEPMTESVPAARPADPVEGAEWLRANWITVAAVLGLVLQLWWRAGVLAHSYFQQNDFPLLYRAAAAKFGLFYLLTPADGQLAPAGRAVVWLEARGGLYNWDLASAVTLGLLALAGLALLRLLRRLFGNRPAILAPYALYLVTPLVVPAEAWWSSTLAVVPLQIATFMAMDAHLCYLRTGRFRHAAAAAWWMVAAVLFADKGALIPLLLLALTSAFLLPGGRPASLVAAVRGFWRGWLLYTAVIAAYLALAIVRLSGSGFTPRPMAAGQGLSFVSSLVGVGLIPALAGGPWRWWSTGSYATAARMPVLTVVSWLAVAAAVLASIWFRKRAWRAWLIAIAWLAIADVVPVLAGWVGAVVTPPDTADLGYLADAVPVLVVCAALAFWPVQGEESPYRNRPPVLASRSVITVNAVGLIAVSSLWSAQAFEKATTAVPARSYIATARLALRDVPAEAEIVSEPVPSALMSRAFFGAASNTAAVLGPLAPRSARVRWTTSPGGTVNRLMIFDSQGRLWPAAVNGVSTFVPAGPGSCWRLGTGTTSIPLQSAVQGRPSLAEFGYSGPATTLALRLSGAWHSVSLPAGRHDALIQLPGAGSSVAIRNLSLAQPGCLTYLTVGTVQPSPYGSPQPANPVSG
jgi:hypothetical protein